VVAEAIVNAVVHRDYTSNASVQVMLFKDRLEIWNPGVLPPNLTLQSLRGPHASIPANPLLAEPMYLTKYIERMGTGIRDMIDCCKAAGLSEPEIRIDSGSWIMTIRRKTAQVGTKSGRSRDPVAIIRNCLTEKAIS
jgi:predicted HTH transcriptional regulator